MNIERVPIESVRDAADPRPWYAMRATAASLIIDEASQGGAESAVKGARRALTSFATAAAAAGEGVALLVDSGGALQLVPFSKQPRECLAHLAWYFPETDTLRVLDFIDVPPAPVEEV